MTELSSRTLRRALAAALAALAAVPALAQAAPPDAPNVMTRNLYLGADLTPVIASLTVPGFPLTPDQAGAVVFAQVQRTNFPARAKLLAKEIDDSDPWLIGLQEVAKWTSGPLLDPAEATDVEYDLLTTLLAELDARGLHYARVALQDEFVTELPVTQGPGTPAYFKDIRLLMRDVILARTDLPARRFAVSNGTGANYATTLGFPLPGGATLPVKRGWTSVDVRVNRKAAVKFVNTHLEAFNDAVKQGQAAELVAGPASSSRPVILVGDLNSDPAGGQPGAYNIVAGAGFVDNANTADTCCYDAEVLTGTFDERIDHILTRPGIAGLLPAIVTGTDPLNRTPGGLWPSDHGGLVAGFGL